MELGAFSISLAVRDLNSSQSFYEKLGFEVMGGMPEHGWLILKNNGCVLGLFQGMFERNMLTFNPGWDAVAQPLTEFQDIREIQAALKADGAEFVEMADPAGTGPAHIILHDPDGNPVMLDQHVDAPNNKAEP